MLENQCSSCVSRIEMATTRKFFVGGNWKCFGTMQSVSDLGGKLKSAKVPSGDIVGSFFVFF